MKCPDPQQLQHKRFLPEFVANQNGRPMQNWQVVTSPPNEGRHWLERHTMADGRNGCLLVSC